MRRKCSPLILLKINVIHKVREQNSYTDDVMHSSQIEMEFVI